MNLNLTFIMAAILKFLSLVKNIDGKRYEEQKQTILKFGYLERRLPPK